MKATFNEIVENLVKVFTDKAESAQYYSDNEQYTGICGWCGVMSPESRPAYIKTFGKATTEAAEAKAREIIAEKEAARQRTRYAEHAQEADRLEGVPAVGGFFWASIDSTARNLIYYCVAVTACGITLANRGK